MFVKPGWVRVDERRRIPMRLAFAHGVRTRSGTVRSRSEDLALQRYGLLDDGRGDRRDGRDRDQQRFAVRATGGDLTGQQPGKPVPPPSGGRTG